MADDPQQKIDAYLNRIRGRLRGLRAEERREILESCEVTSWRRPRWAG
jgi:hypothetical protein